MKRILMFAAALVLLCTMLLPVQAATGKVTYDGKAKEFVFAPGSEYSLTDLFPNFKDVMPGDTLTQEITVKNDASKKVKVKIYMRALGAQNGSQEFLSQMGLQVKKSANNSAAYMFDATAEKTAQLTDWVCLGTLYSGGKVNLDVTLLVPVEMDNQFQDSIGYLDWEFKVEEFPVDPSDPETPKTGDDTALGLWIGLAVISLGGIFFLILWKKKDKKEKA